MTTTNIDKLIAEKSEQQALKEWHELLMHMYHFFKLNKCGDNNGQFNYYYSSLQSKTSNFFQDENKEHFLAFEKLLFTFGKAWRSERKLRLINDKTKELVEKVSLL